jgi:hypothetical protein
MSRLSSFLMYQRLSWKKLLARSIVRRAHLIQERYTGNNYEPSHPSYLCKCGGENPDNEAYRGSHQPDCQWAAQMCRTCEGDGLCPTCTGCGIRPQGKHPDGCHSTDATSLRDCHGDGHYSCRDCTRREP